MAEDMTRREFVLAASVLAAGVAVTGVTGCSAASRNASTAEAPSFAFNGGGEMGQRVLVGYATRTSTTTGVAEEIGKVLAARGYDVDVKPLRERPAIDGYDAVVLGSAVNGGQWLPEAVDFVESNRGKLGHVPVAAFCVHIMNAGDDEKQTKRRLAYLDKVRSSVKLVDEGFFLGKGPTAEEASLVMRWAFKAFGGSGEGDCRDWDKIRAWGQSVLA